MKTLLLLAIFALLSGALGRVAFNSKHSFDLIEDNVEVPVELDLDDIHERNRYIDTKSDTRAATLNEGRSASGCSVMIRGGLTDPQPIFLKTDSEEFYPYSAKGVMEFSAGDTFEMWCPKQFTGIRKTLIKATCVSDTVFKVDGTSYDFKEFVCTSWPNFVVEKTGETCNGGIMLRSGFKITTDRFASQMSICFDEDEEVTRYVHHKLNPGSNYYQSGVSRITFQTSGFFDGKNVDKLYTQVTQMATITDELGDDGEQYFDLKKNIFLARGHLGAKADFVYGTQQRGTFLFVNAAPQWQVFNAGNWERVEEGVRSWVTKNSLNVECYTGVYGVTSLPNKNGVETPLYLTYDKNRNGLIPVPMLYFRVVIDSASKRGIVFIGVNNPHLTLEQIQKNYILCDDVGDQVTYVSWKKEDLTAGYSYACTVEDFVQKVQNIPDLAAPGGLLI